MTSEHGTSRAALAALLPEVPRRRLAWLALLMVLSALSEGIGLLLLVPILGALNGGPQPGAASRYLADLGVPADVPVLLAAFVLLVAIRAFVQYRRVVDGRMLANGLVDASRAALFSALVRADWRRLVRMRQSDNVGLIVNTVDRIGMAFDQLLAATAAAVALGGVLATAMVLSPRLALFGLVAAALVLAGYSRNRIRAVRLGEALTEAHRSVHARLGESLSALRLIKGHSAEARAEAEMGASFVGMRRTEMDYLRSMTRGQAALQVSGAAVLALASWLAIARWQVPAAVLIPLVALFARTVPLLGALQEAWQNWLHGAPAVIEAKRLRSDLLAHAESRPTDTVAPPRLLRTVRAEGVSLQHPGRPVSALAGVTLELRANSTTALIGPSGAGKSTLADVLGGLVTPDAGRVLVDDVALDGPARLAWRGAVAYVEQEPVLFHATIRQNLLWAVPEADEAALFAALDQASAGFVRGLPQGLDTIVGDRGGQLSGGERQRIALARALLRKPALLILDEPTSALDSDNEAAVLAALKALRGSVTMLVIAHRGALAGLADRTVRLETGRIVAEEVAA